MDARREQTFAWVVAPQSGRLDRRDCFQRRALLVVSLTTVVEALSSLKPLIREARCLFADARPESLSSPRG